MRANSFCFFPSLLFQTHWRDTFPNVFLSFNLQLNKNMKLKLQFSPFVSSTEGALPVRNSALFPNQSIQEEQERDDLGRSHSFSRQNQHPHDTRYVGTRFPPCPAPAVSCDWWRSIVSQSSVCRESYSASFENKKFE